MDLKTKCRKCISYGDCQIQSSLNELVKKAIKETENNIKKEIPSDIDYFVVTDVTLIPTNCHQFAPKEKPVSNLLKPAGIFSKGSLATT